MVRSKRSHPKAVVASRTPPPKSSAPNGGSAAGRGGTAAGAGVAVVDDNVKFSSALKSDASFQSITTPPYDDEFEASGGPDDHLSDRAYRKRM